MSSNTEQPIKKFLEIVNEGWFGKKAPDYQKLSAQFGVPVELVQQILTNQNPLQLLYSWTSEKKISFFQFYHILEMLYLQDK